jgi:hypothetical protein
VSTETQNRGVMPQDLIEVCMTGNVTRPVARREAGGTVFCTIPLASNYRPYRDPQGNTVQPPPCTSTSRWRAPRRTPARSTSSSARR